MATFRSYSKLKEAILSRSTNCTSVTEFYIQEIKKNKHLNAFVEVFNESALLKAKEVDQKIKSGSFGKLAGMIIALKDNICYKEHKVTASSKILQDFESIYSATVVEKLLSEDAIIIGRLNCDEFAMGSSNENSIYGAVKNPSNNNKVAGGSSGGAAAAVAAGLCLAALGSDTGGSVRQPASFCGVVGLKPTYSRVSRHGLIAYASSFDQIGPITNNIEDSALILEVIAGKDNFDSTCSLKEPDKYTSFSKKINSKKIGYILESLNPKFTENQVRKHTENVIKKLKLKGHEVEPISFPHMDLFIPTYYVISTAEASSNLARFDGVHYGYRSENSNNLEETYYNSRTEGFGEEVKRRIMLGTFVLSSNFHDEYFIQAQKIRRLIKEKTEKIFMDYDFIISPTTPHTAFNIGEKHENPTKMYLEDIFTVQANLSGAPAISIPTGKDSNGLAIGTHIMSNHFKEKELLAFAKEVLKSL